MEKLLTVDELSEILQVSKPTIYRWVHWEFIPHYKIGNAVRFEMKAVEKWLKARETKGRKKMLLS
ncbi:MAG: helix-turn-helix domain-containing protein [Paludibacter sp.]